MSMRTIGSIKVEYRLSIPKTVTTKRELNFSKNPETATTIPVGTQLEVYFSEKNPSRLYFDYAGSLRAILLVNAWKNVTGFVKPPSIATLEKWEWQSGTCKTVLGNVTEPDGHDQFGAPSWMLVMGVI